jgi:hypothetical protein
LKEKGGKHTPSCKIERVKPLKAMLRQAQHDKAQEENAIAIKLMMKE